MNPDTGTIESTQSRARWISAVLAVALVALAAGSRLWFETPNFAAAGAVALFAGFLFRDRWLALGVPMVAMLASDLVIGFYNPVVMASVYLCLLISAALGRLLAKRPTLTRVTGACLAGSVVFFLCTNFAVWASDGLYPQNARGMVACYAAAVPFFRFTVTSDMLFAASLFGAWGIARVWAGRGRAVLVPAAAMPSV